MSTTFVAPRPLEFPSNMLVRLCLGEDANVVCDEYGYDYNAIKDQPHFIAQIGKVESELFKDGAITRVIAGHGLHTVVDKLSHRALDDRTATSDMVKIGEFLKRVKDDGKDNNTNNNAKFSIEISFNGEPTKIELDVTPPKGVPKEVPILSVEEDEPIEIPENLMDAYHNTDTASLHIDFES